MREHGLDPVPVYMYMIPGLEFVETGLQWYESHFGCRIVRVPHPDLYKFLAEGYFCPPQFRGWCSRLARFSFRDVEDAVCETLGLPVATTWRAVGVRALDSQQRRFVIKRHGSMRESSLKAFPVWDWPKARLMEALKRNAIKLSPEYTALGRSFEIITSRSLIAIKEHFPADFARIKRFYPLAEVAIKRYEWQR